MAKSIRGLEFNPITDDRQRLAIIEVLRCQALADHLGDVRDEEKTLWHLLGVEKLEYGEDEDAYGIFKATCRKNGLPLDDDEESGVDDEDAPK